MQRLLNGLSWSALALVAGFCALQALAHADLLHAEVGGHQVDLLGERGLVRAHLRQRGAQVAGELAEHRATRAGVGLA